MIKSPFSVSVIFRNFFGKRIKAAFKFFIFLSFLFIFFGNLYGIFFDRNFSLLYNII